MNYHGRNVIALYRSLAFGTKGSRVLTQCTAAVGHEQAFALSNCLPDCGHSECEPSVTLSTESYWLEWGLSKMIGRPSSV